MNEIIKLIKDWVLRKRCGKIIINFYKGGVTGYEVRETFKPEK
jgi:hypothetical protein